MFKQFTALTSKEKKDLNSRFILPIELNNLVVRTSDNMPCEIIGEAKVSCTRKKHLLLGVFHNKAARVNC